MSIPSSTPPSWLSARSVGLILSGIALFISASLSIWTHRHRNGRVVRAGQPTFLHMLCIGTAILAISLIPLSDVLAVDNDDSIASDNNNNDASCQSIPWLLCIGISTIYSSLSSKTYRVNRIFNQPRFRRVQVRVVDALWPALGLLGANLMVLVLWTVISPLRWEISETGIQYESQTYQHGTCTSQDAAVFAIPLAITNVGGIIYSLHEAWRARNVPPLYSESSCILSATSYVLIAAILGVPVLFMSRDFVPVFYFVFAAMVFITCCSNLVFIFVPKIKSYGALENEKKLDLAARLHRQGVKMAAAGEYRDALQKLEKALYIRQKVLGRDNESTIETTAAITQLFDRIRSVGIKVATNVANSIIDHAAACEKGGNVDKAHQLAQEALDLLESFDDKALVALETAVCCTLLGRIHYQMENYDMAYYRHNQALNIHIAASNTYDELVLKSLSYTAEALLAAGKPSQAVALAFHVREFSKMKSNIGTDNSSYMRALYILAVAYHSVGRTLEAQTLLEQRLEALESCGYQDYESAACLIEYGDILTERGKNRQALSVYTQAKAYCPTGTQLEECRLKIENSQRRWFRRRSLVLPKMSTSYNISGMEGGDPLIIITDVGRDSDDELALCLLAPLRSSSMLKPVAVVTTLSPQSDRARLARGILDSFGLHDIPVGIGSSGGAETAADINGATFEASASINLTEGGVGIRPDGIQLMSDILHVAHPRSVRLLCIASLTDAAHLITRHEEIFATKVTEVVVMGGVTPQELEPDTAYNNNCDMDSARLVYRKCQELGVPIITLTRYAAYGCSFSNTMLDDLRSTENVVITKIRNNFLSSLDKLWLKVNLPPEDVRRNKLPARCDRQWFLKTFLDEEAADSMRLDKDDSMLDQRINFHMYDPLALLCCIPSLREKFFKVKILLVDQIEHGVIGQSERETGIVDANALQDEIRSLLLRALNDSLHISY